MKKAPTKITEKSMIGAVIQEYPFAADIMLSKGLHCVGCHVAFDESLGQGATAHGMDKKEIKQMIDAINSRATALAEAKDGIAITDEAAVKIREFLKKDKKAGMRITSVQGHIEITFTDGAKKGEDTLIVNGLKVFTDKKALKEMGGSLIDFVSTMHGSGLKVYNPHMHLGCGCC